MTPEPEHRQQPRSRPFGDQRHLTINRHGPNGSGAIVATLLEFSEGGIRVQIPSQLEPGWHVEVVGVVEGPAGPRPLRRRGMVRECSASGDGMYVARLSFESGSNGSGRNLTAEKDELPDHYEIMELSRNASPETIQRVFRILAKRYHPDNGETGNPALFREIMEAHRVLSHPEERAAYDAQLGVQKQNRFKVFETWQDSRGVEGEKRKRQAILALLYSKRLTDPEHPSLGVRELEEMLECPREHLQFSLWFLKESQWVSRSDNHRYEITCQGALIVEAEQCQPSRTPLAQLPASKRDGGS
jgi:DnaJ-like protein